MKQNALQALEQAHFERVNSNDLRNCIHRGIFE